jgi:hypothetical protein
VGDDLADAKVLEKIAAAGLGHRLLVGGLSISAASGRSSLT